MAQPVRWPATARVTAKIAKRTMLAATKRTASVDIWRDSFDRIKEHPATDGRRL
jgi:hypothetical protein